MKCPICGEKVKDTGKLTTNGRRILSCGDAAYLRGDVRYLIEPHGSWIRPCKISIKDETDGPQVSIYI